MAASPPFLRGAAREVTNRQIAARITEKAVQVSRSDRTLPTYIVVVEFSAPVVRVEKR